MEDGSYNSEVNSEVLDGMYSARELFEMHLPGHEITERAWLNRVKKQKWEFVEIPCQGGFKHIYRPPPEILALIKACQRTALPSAAHSVREPAPRYDDSIFIDQYVNVSGSAGPGVEIGEETIVQVRVDTRLLRQRVGGNFAHIKIASVSGDSMEPTLSHGDQVLVDTSCDRFIDNAIYAIQQDGHLRFKRIQLKLDGSIVVKSDSTPDVETYSAQDAQQFHVVGIIIPFKFGRFKV